MGIQDTPQNFRAPYSTRSSPMVEYGVRLCCATIDYQRRTPISPLYDVSDFVGWVSEAHPPRGGDGGCVSLIHPTKKHIFPNKKIRREPSGTRSPVDALLECAPCATFLGKPLIWPWRCLSTMGTTSDPSPSVANGRKWVPEKLYTK